MIKTTLFAAAAALILAAGPAMAQYYQTDGAQPLSDRVESLSVGSEQMPVFDGQAVVMHDQAVANDVGSTQYPVFNGQAAIPAPQERLVMPNASEAEVQSPNSLPVAITR